MKQGTVKWYDSKKGYGFISPDGEAKDVFVHVSQLEKAGLPGLDSTQRVGFEIYDDRGELRPDKLKFCNPILI